jgi:hypothetical protein
MTTQEMVTELARSLGNRTDITNARYITWLNWSILEVCGMWRRGLISPVRFHTLEGYKLFSTAIVSDTVVAAASSTVQLAAGDVQADDYYNDWVVEITAYDEAGAGTTTPAGLLYQKRAVYDYVQLTNTITIASAWDTIPDAYTTYTIYKRRYSILTDVGISPVNSLMSFQRIEQQSDSLEIKHVEWVDMIGSDYTSLGSPTRFAHRGESLILDPTPDSAIKYRVYYYRYPTAFLETNLTAECEFPIDWHEIIVLGAVYRGFEKLMEPDRAVEANKQFISAAVRQSSSSIADAEISRGLRIKRE